MGSSSSSGSCNSISSLSSSVSCSKTSRLKFNDLNEKLKKIISDKKEIKKLYLLKSPITSTGLVGTILNIEHHEVMFEFDLVFINYYVILSFGDDGLEVVMS